ncbi:MAG TPA: Hsp70 family protein [Candidatus Dormibacteraeota bacterium]|jgi:hypothetical chaperone protein|nr:Hsp70 family protein [Candidatus Dormibacteraeota bacterium]
MSEIAAIGCGIDFGTSNSAVSVAYPDRVEVVRVETGGTPSLPSVAFLHRDGLRLAGVDAAERYFAVAAERTSCADCSLVAYGFSDCRHYQRDGGCADSRLVTGIKRDLGRMEGPVTHSWAVDFRVPDLAEAIMRGLRGPAGEHGGGAPFRCVVGHPVVFPAATDSASSAQELALSQLGEAARQAGFEEVEFFPEPIAAVMDEHLDDGWVLSVDFGGGTYDVALIRVEAGEPEVRALGGVAIGGEQIDEALFETRIAPAMGLDRLPNWLANELRSLAGARQLLMDPRLPGVLDGIGTAASRVASRILYGGFVFSFYKRLEAAKISLSSQREVRVEFHRQGVNLDLQVERGELEGVCSPELDRVIEATRETLQRAGLDGSEVGRVLRTGGSSRMPAFIRRIAELCPDARLEERDAFTGVARGLGARARQLWQG